MTTRKNTKQANKKTASPKTTAKKTINPEVKPIAKAINPEPVANEVKMIDNLLDSLNLEVETVEPAEKPVISPEINKAVNNVIEKALEGLNEVVAKAKEANEKKTLISINTDPQYAEIKKLVGGIPFTQKKVREKANGLVKFLFRGGKVNRVIQIALQTLKKDGYLETGEKGNLFQALLAKPYSKGTARAQSGQIIDLFPKMNLVTRQGNRLIPNEKSNLDYITNKVFAS